jgi:Reverse transcriptase (RNA-dependent DNA polymerase)
MTTSQHTCPICGTMFTSLTLLRLHLVTDGRHTQVDLIHRLDQLRSMCLHVCTRCSTPAVFLGPQGLSLHCRHMHAGVLPATVRSLNSQLIHQEFGSSDYNSAWLDTLTWLNSDFLHSPPPFRQSLLEKTAASVRSQVMDAAISILHAIDLASQGHLLPNTGPDFESSLRPLLRLFFLFEAVILAPPVGDEPTSYAKLVPLRLLRFRHGEFHAMFIQVFSQSPQPRASAPSSDSTIQISSIVESALRKGDYRAAMRRLDPEPRALLSPDHLATLRAMHPPQLSHCLREPAAPTASLDCFHLSELASTIRSSPRGKAPGYLADSPDFLLGLGPHKYPRDPTLTGASLLQRLAFLYLSGNVPSDCWIFLNANYLMALHKDFTTHPSKLRPIGIGTAFRRLLARHIAKSHAAAFTEFFLPDQFALGVSGGMDFIIHNLQHAVSARLYSAAAPDCIDHVDTAILKLDFVNMFNQVSRSVVREELALSFPHLLWIFEHLYPSEGNQVWFQHPDGSWDSFFQQEGLAQGCPLSSFFACLVLRRLLRNLSSALIALEPVAVPPPTASSPSSILLAYMDDTHSIARLSDVPFIFHFLDEHGPPLGLVLSRDKCRILLSTSGSFPFSRLPATLVRDLECVAATFCRGTFEFWGLDILGIPIGNPKLVADSLSDFMAQFDRTLNLLHSQNLALRSRLRLFLLCAQAQIPFRLFADACLPSTTLALSGSSSPFISRLQGSIQRFLATLVHSSEPAFPDYAWDLATLPIKHGGLGVQDPASFSLVAFIRPILRSLQYIHRGFPVGTSQRDVETSWVSLPPYLRSVFADWESSSVPWLVKFRTCATSFLQLVSSDTNIHSLVSASDSPSLSCLTSAHHHLLYENYIQRRSHFPYAVQVAEPSLRSVFTSIALTSLPFQVAAYRMEDSLFLLGLKRKLRLPLGPLHSHCSCGSMMDDYGDHFYSCLKRSKTVLHNRIRDSFYFVCAQLAPYAAFTSSEADVACEPTGLLPEHPSLRPADVAFRLLPSALASPVSHLLLDFTLIPMPPLLSHLPSDAADPLLFSVVRHHEVFENGKLAGKSARPRSFDVIASILARNFALLPITIDPGGQLGPFATAFLWDPDRRPSSALSPSLVRSSRGLSSPASLQAASLASMVSRSGFLRRADQGWRKEHGHDIFTRSYTARLPSQWATQVIGYNLLVALSRHLLVSISSADPFKSSSGRTLATAASRPRLSRPLLPLPGSHFLRYSLTRSGS